MNSNNTRARIAGLLYCIVVVTGIFNLAYMPSKLIVWNNTATTFKNNTAHETLFHLGIMSGLICYTAFLLLPIVLYKVLKPINKACALLIVVFAVVSVPISLINLENKFSVLTILAKAEDLKGFAADKLQEQVLFLLHSYSNGNKIASIFWGFWFCPLAI